MRGLALARAVGDAVAARASLHRNTFGRAHAAARARVLAVAETQAMRLAQYGKIRRAPGYDLGDDLIDDSNSFALVAGTPCLVVGSEEDPPS